MTAVTLGLKLRERGYQDQVRGRMASVDVVLKKLDQAVAEVRGHYEADLRAQEVSDELLYAVRAAVQDAQSALDWTANAVKEKYAGSGKRSPYFPLVKDAAEFSAAMEKQIKGLAAAEPNIAAAFERHQPYQPDKGELGYLHALAKVNKHRDFTAQTRTEQRRIRAAGAGGAVVEWTPDTGSGGVTFGPGVSIGGVPVDVRTQRPVPHTSQTVTETIYVDWRFVDPAVSVLPTLEKLAGLTRAAVEDVRGEAQL